MGDHPEDSAGPAQPEPPPSPPSAGTGIQAPTHSGGFAGWLERAKRHPIVLIVGLLVSAVLAVATIGGFVLALQDRSDPPSAATASTATPSTDGTGELVEPLDDLAIAEQVVLTTDDLGRGWASVTRRPREESEAAFAAIPRCQAFVPVVRGDGETAAAGHDLAYFLENTAVSATVTFYETVDQAIAAGPDLLLDGAYQACIRELNTISINDSNDDVTNLDIGSQEIAVPSYGQRSIGVQHTADFEIPLLGRKEQFTDEFSIQIGRAVLLMTWSSDSEFDPLEFEVLQTLGTRFSRTMALYGD